MENIITTFHPKHVIEESGPYPYEYKPIICMICEKKLSLGFYCSICDFHFHKECAASLMEWKLTIHRPETHEHTLTFIRMKNFFTCDACGNVDKGKMNMYACLLCNFFVHRNCIYLPKVIKLTRHSHRLFHTFQVAAAWDTKCAICNKPCVSGCGGYICVDKTCDYKLHSYCARDTKVWDGVDVEKEPEETSNSEDGGPLEEVNGKIVRHFSHHHDLMRLRVKDEEEEDGRVCQACILPIDFDGFLGCKECDFALHDICASLPRKMEHALHRHPLILEVDMMNSEEGFFRCSKCKRESCGFMYRCCHEECEFTMDAKCASLTDPLRNRAHQHPLTLTVSGIECHEPGCYFPMSFKQATLPVLVKYKHDTHPLALYILQPYNFVNRNIMLIGICEICEVEIREAYYLDFYGCTDCSTTLHVACVIGKYPYLKPGHTIKVNGYEIEIASNSFSRPICNECFGICQGKLIFKNNRDAVSICSINCIKNN